MGGRKNNGPFIFLSEALLFFSDFLNYSLIFSNCFNGLPFPFDSPPLQAGAFTRHSFSVGEEHQREARAFLPWHIERKMTKE